MSDIITITGNIATEPEERRLPNGASVVSFRLASTLRRYDREAGRWTDGSTNWYTVSTFRRLAAHVLASLHKGERVIVTGKLKLRTWENASGRGMAAEVDAEGVGHDLLWGTSTFSKDPGGTAPDQATTSWSVPAEDRSDQWSAPLSDAPALEARPGEPSGARPVDAASASPDDDRDRSLVGAGATVVGAEGDTPF